jgi:hypothetical protein
MAISVFPTRRLHDTLRIMVEANVDTGGGRQNCFLKARAAVATVTAK